MHNQFLFHNLVETFNLCEKIMFEALPPKLQALQEDYLKRDLKMPHDDTGKKS